MKTITLFSALVLLCLSGTFSNGKYKSPQNNIGLISHHAAAGIFGAFHAHRQQNDVALAWSVTSDGVSEFIIERSYDGNSFQPIDNVPPAEGAWNRYRDNTALPGYSYYRVKAIMNDETFEYSEVVVVRIVKRG